MPSLYANTESPSTDACSLMLQHRSGQPAHLTDDFRSRSMLCSVLHKEFADPPPEHVVQHDTGNSDEQPTAVAFKAKLRPIIIVVTANAPEVPIVWNVSIMPSTVPSSPI